MTSETSTPTIDDKAPLYRITIDLPPTERRMYDALMSDTSKKGAEIIREAIRLMFHVRSRRKQGYKLTLRRGIRQETVEVFDDILSDADERFIAGESHARSISKLARKVKK